MVTDPLGFSRIKIFNLVIGLVSEYLHDILLFGLRTGVLNITMICIYLVSKTGVR